MSNMLFPELVFGGEFSKKPMFNTNIMTSINGRELRASYQAVPKYEIVLNIPLIDGRTKDLDTIEEFFNARRGSFESFLFRMPWDDFARCEFVGDGIKSTFQMYKGSSPIGNTDSFKSEDPDMWLSNSSAPMWAEPESDMWVLQYQLNSNGLVVLDFPLAEGDKITVESSYYYRCRFANDSQAFSLFSYKLWKCEVTLIGSLGNKL